MTAPAGGFLAVKAFCPALQRRLCMYQTFAARGGKNVRSLAATVASIFSNGVRSSKIQMDRPCVASTRSFCRACNSISSTGTVGKLFLKAVQFVPRFQEIHK